MLPGHCKCQAQWKPKERLAKFQVRGQASLIIWHIAVLNKHLCKWSLSWVGGAKSIPENSTSKRKHLCIWDSASSSDWSRGVHMPVVNRKEWQVLSKPLPTVSPSMQFEKKNCHYQGPILEQEIVGLLELLRPGLQYQLYLFLAVQLGPNHLTYLICFLFLILGTISTSWWNEMMYNRTLGT